MGMTDTQGNAGQIAYWNGKAGEKWTLNQDSQDRMMAALGARALDAACLQPGERVIDIGCGCGTSTFEIARAVAPGGTVTGFDISRPMLGLARERAGAETIQASLAFIEADAALHLFAEQQTDVVYSRFGVMFFADPNAAFTNIARALRPGGRIAFVCWRCYQDNEWINVPLAAASRLSKIAPPSAEDGPGPFAFDDDMVVRELLRNSGFTDIAIAPFDAPVMLGVTTAAAVRKIVENSPLAAALAEIERPRRAEVMDAVGQAMAPFAGEDGVLIGGAVWIVTARH